MIRPQVKKQKQERKFREEIKKGDKIITSGGLHGKVVEVSDKTVKIDVAKDIILKVDKSCISAELSTVKEYFLTGLRPFFYVEQTYISIQ